MGSLAVKLLPGQLREALGAKGSTIVFALLSFVVFATFYSQINKSALADCQVKCSLLEAKRQYDI